MELNQEILSDIVVYMKYASYILNSSAGILVHSLKNLK